LQLDSSTAIYTNGVGSQITAGLQSKSNSFYLVTGSAIHAGVQEALKGAVAKDCERVIDEVFDTAQSIVAESGYEGIDYTVREQRDLAKALCYVWIKERASRFLSEYKPIAIEPEIRAILYEDSRYKVVLMLRPDAIVERLSDGALLQWELKSKSTLNKNWVDSWEHNLQLVGQQLGVRQFAKDRGLGDRMLGGAYIEALIKGMRKRGDDGQWRQETPLIYAYIKPGDGFAIADQISHSWKRGWERRLVSEVASLEAWVMGLDSEITATKAIVVPPIQPSEYDIEMAAEQWGLRAIQDTEHAQQINGIRDQSERQRRLNLYFPQNTDHCFRFGRCWAYDLCWSPSVTTDPIASGLYKAREPNHPEGDD
jgi:hypothetical protein